MDRLYCSFCGEAGPTMILIQRPDWPPGTLICRQCCDENGYKITAISEAEARQMAAKEGIDIDELLGDEEAA